MSSDMRIIKFESFIKDINETNNRARGFSVDLNLNPHIEMTKLVIGGKVEIYRNPSLLLIYDYDQLNDYGKIILKQSNLYSTKWDSKYLAASWLKKTNCRIDAAKELVEYYKMDEHRKEAYEFIFWAMMVLTVDKTNEEDILSLICDFAKIFKITDEEMLDILQVIKILYYPEMENVDFQSSTILNCFSNLLSSYDNFMI